VSIIVLARDRDLSPVDLNNACKALEKYTLGLIMKMKMVSHAGY